jgi:plasmid stabilization system protein ParE
MRWNLIIKEEAVEDITNAALWYESRQSLLGEGFLKETESALKEIKSNPFLFQLQRQNIRHGYIKRFPFLIIYEVVENTIVVYAVFQAQRNPKKRYFRSKKK